MIKKFSQKIHPKTMTLGGGFNAKSLELEAARDLTSPIVHFDHFRMKVPTFSPHPHAGFSAISYIFPDSDGPIRNRDSLGHDFEVSPGGIVWTQAGTGIVHDELPVSHGDEVHGLQIFINSSSAGKELPPKVLYANGEDIPVVKINSSIVRIVAGTYAYKSSPVQPHDESLILDIELIKDMPLTIDEGWNAVIYAATGSLELHSEGEILALTESTAAGFRGGQSLVLKPKSASCRVVVLAGEKITQPNFRAGPFMQNSQEALMSAMQRYRSGEMGHLGPLSR